MPNFLNASLEEIRDFRIYLDSTQWQRFQQIFVSSWERGGSAHFIPA